MTDFAHLEGKGKRAPLDPSRTYSFRRSVTPNETGKWELTIPWKQRGSWDDFGAVEHEEQEALVRELILALGMPSTGGYPGTWSFDDASALDRLWTALSECISR